MLQVRSQRFRMLPPIVQNLQRASHGAACTFRSRAAVPMYRFVTGGGLTREKTMKNALLLTVAVAAATPTSSLTAYAQLPAQQPQAAVLLTMIENLLATATMVRARQGNLDHQGNEMERDLLGAKLDSEPRGPGRAAADHDDGFPVGRRQYRLGRQLRGALGSSATNESARTGGPSGPGAASHPLLPTSFSTSSSSAATAFGVVIGAEIVVGGTAGAVAGAETPVTAVFGAVTGAASMIGVSDVVVSHFVNAPEPPAAPAPPARPAPPQAGTMLVANAGRSYIVVQEGTIKAAGPRQQDNDFYAARGSYNGTSAQGELYLSQ